MSDPNVTSNIDDIGAMLDQLVDTFDMTRPGIESSLGQDLATVVAEGIRDRTVIQGLDANGAPLKPNERKYAARKARIFSALQPLIRGGQMLSLASLIGDVRVNGNELEMHYGTGDEEPAQSSTGVNLPRTVDRKTGAMEPPPTDREKAGYCTDGGRPFYALDDLIAAQVTQVAGEVLGEHIKAHS